MSDPTLEEQIKELAKQMGDAGYCNYDACEDFLRQAADLALAAAENETLSEMYGHDTGEMFNRIIESIRAIKLSRETGE